MSDHYTVDVDVEGYGWLSVLQTEGFVETLAKVIDERKVGNTVRVTITGDARD